MTDRRAMTPEELKSAIASVLERGLANQSSPEGDVDQLFEQFTIYHQELEYQNDELRRISLELETKKAYWNDLYENAPLAYVTFNEDFGMQSGNRAFRELLGLDRVTLANKPLTHYLEPDCQDAFYLHTKSVWKGQKTPPCQVRVHMARKILHFRVDSNLSPFDSASNEPAALVRSQFVDVTREVEAEAQLRRSDERFQGVVETATDGILLADESGRILVWNASMEAITGHLRDGILGLFIWEVQFMALATELRTEQNRASLEKFNRELLVSLKSGQSVNPHETVIVKQDGSKATVEYTLYPLRLKDELLFGGIFRDLTYSRGLEEQLAQARKTEAIGLLAGGIAHDFNNLLGVILGRVELARVHQLVPATLANDLRQIEDAAKRSATITSQLLTYARKQVSNPQVVHLNPMLAAMAPTLGQLLGPGIELRIETTAEQDGILLDPGQLEQIVTNLCANARDSMTGRGHLRLTTSFDNQTDRLRLTVTDSGSGMDATTLAKAFEPFFTTKSMGHGTGLGLSTVQGIVYQNRGEIHLTSEVGKGTTVVVEFPLYYGPDYGAPTAESPPRPLASKRILVVDDEADIVEFLTQVLATQGHEVQSAESAESALKWAQADRGFDLLVTDVMLPGKNGRQLANELAASIPGLVVLYISGYSGDVLAEQGVLGPDVHFLQKPFTLSEVTAKLSAILNA